jgi:hypothetical protein
MERLQQLGTWRVVALAHSLCSFASRWTVHRGLSSVTISAPEATMGSEKIDAACSHLTPAHLRLPWAPDESRRCQSVLSSRCHRARRALGTLSTASISSLVARRQELLVDQTFIHEKTEYVETRKHSADVRDLAAYSGSRCACAVLSNCRCSSTRSTAPIWAPF